MGRGRLAADLRRLGLRREQDLLVHCSLRRIGPVEGGAATLLAALRDVAGPRATVVVPTQTAQNSFTSRDFRAAVVGLDEDERVRYVAAMPGFEPARTPSYRMGSFAEYLRTRPSAVRSRHPQTSFAALGPRARTCTSVHDLDCHLGGRSPLGWLYDADAAVLLLGVSYSACTAFHLAEYHLPGVPPTQTYHCFTAEGGKRIMHEFTAVALDDSDFEALGAALEAVTPAVVSCGRVGAGVSRMMPVRAAVDFSVCWLATHRRLPHPGQSLSPCPFWRSVPTMVPVLLGREGVAAIMTSRCGSRTRELRGCMPWAGELTRSGRSACARSGREAQPRIPGEAVGYGEHQRDE